MADHVSNPEPGGSFVTGLSPSLDGVVAHVLKFLQTGGPVVAILLVMSIVAMALVLVKLGQFYAVRIGQRQFINSAWVAYRAGDAARVLAELSLVRNPIARVMEAAIRGQTRAEIPEATVREEVTRVANLHLERLRSYLRGLEVIGTLSPLLGLFGTVLGMIDAFQQLEAVGNRVDATVLSRGIWEALLTTAVGLTVAIPVVAIATWLERKVDRLGHDMEDAATRVFTVALTVLPDSRQNLGLDHAEPENSN